MAPYLALTLVPALATPAQTDVAAMARTESLVAAVRVRVERIELEASVAAWREQLATGALLDVATALDSATVNALLSERVLAGVERAELVIRYGDKHPERILSTQRIAELEAQIREEIERVLRGKDVQIGVLRATEEALLTAG